MTPALASPSSAATPGTAEGIRWTAGDLSTGEGIEAAMRGAEVIVHCAGSSKGDEQKTRTLVSAAKDARHIVLISVVGADRIPQASAIDRAFFGYFGMKLATERVVEQSGIGWTTLRATQFHDLILMVARALAKLPVIPAPPGSRFQPVDATEVAERMAELALGEPSGLVPTWQARKSTLWPSWSTATCARPASIGRWSRCTFQARPPGRSGPVRTWPRIALSASGHGRIPGRPDLGGTQGVQIRSSSGVDMRQSPVDQIGGSARVLAERVSLSVAHLLR